MRELTREEVNEVSGGIDAAKIALGVAMLGLGVGIAATGGLAAVPIGIILGAGTAGEIFLAGTVLALGAGGGAAIGSGLCY